MEIIYERRITIRRYIDELVVINDTSDSNREHLCSDVKIIQFTVQVRWFN